MAMRNFKKLSDLPTMGYMFYIGDIVEVEGSNNLYGDGWVAEDVALLLLAELNAATNK